MRLVLIRLVKNLMGWWIVGGGPGIGFRLSLSYTKPEQPCTCLGSPSHCASTLQFIYISIPIQSLNL